MYAIIEFGSNVRGKSDGYSDKDLMVICQDRERKNILNRKELAGYNISFFSEKQLLWMKSKGSLFLQHIKKDGRILFDKKNCFEVFINGCNFVLPSDIELKKCKNTLSFLSEIPDNNALMGWKADFLYCSSRDYLIKKIASKGYLAFGMDEIERFSFSIFNLSEGDFIKLKSLRKIKASYRDNKSVNLCPSAASEAILNWLKVLEVTFHIKNSQSQLSLVKSLSKQDFSSSYERLRCLEALYILAQEKGVYHIEHNKILSFMKSPNLYKILQASKKDMLKKYFFDIQHFFN